MTLPLRVAVVGAGPAGIYTADTLRKADPSVQVDIIDRDPTPFGLIRYGVAPDHPRIKEIVTSLGRAMTADGVRFIGNVEVGADVKLNELRALYDAVVVATGASRDRDIQIPGATIEGSFGAAEFVAWYDGHPDAPRDWAFSPEAESVAVIGAGNVALDVARLLAKSADELLDTEIPDNVYSGLKINPARDIHIFARRGPAQVKFTPMELRELSHSPSIDVIVHPEGFEIDEGSLETIRNSKSVKLVVDVLQNYLARDPSGAPHRIHLHFCQQPVEILEESGKVAGLRTEVTELDGTGEVRGTGVHNDWPVQAVYRAIGYYSDPIAELPFDVLRGVIPNDKGRVIGPDGAPIPGVYVTGWIKRGPIGLIGHTKSDSAETVECLLSDLGTPSPDRDRPSWGLLDLLDERDVAHTGWEGWTALDRHEIEQGVSRGRPRIKVVPRDEMVRISRGNQPT